jgi:hypothetical protein
MKKISIITVLLVVFLIFSVKSNAQENPNIGFLRSVPQSWTVNPASEVPCNVWIGMPGLSSFQFSFENTGFRYKDVIYRSSDDSLHFDIDNFLNVLEKTNYININLNTEILGFGFRVKRNYYDIRLTERFSNSIMYSDDLMAFLLKLNGQFIGQNAEFNGTGLNLSYYHELSFGMRREINDHWSTGVRFKYLAGVANISSRKTDISIYTDPYNAYALTVHSNLEINTSIPGISLDKADSLQFKTKGGQITEDLLGVKNPGCALDLGVQFSPNKRLLFGASILDLGFIQWRNNTRSYISDNKNHDYTFEGIDIADIIVNDSSTFGEQFQNILDSLSGNLGLKTVYGDYTSALTTRINFTFQYNLSNQDHVGVILQNTLVNRHLKPAITINYNHEFGKVLTLMTGYTASKRNVNNLALGFSLKFLGLQIYALSDNAYAFYKPTDFRFVNIHFGINFVIGDKRSFKQSSVAHKQAIPALPKI